MALMARVSVIMPCFNHALFVRESIEAVLTQSVRDLELIVVDDCSRDGSKEVIKECISHDHRARAIYHEANLGASRSRNDGMVIAHGEYVAFCDADDVWMPTKLERQLELLERHPAHGVAYCDAGIINEYGMETGERFSDQFPVPGNGSGRLFDELCTRNFVNMQTVVLRRKCIVDAGYFDESVKWVEDWLFWLKVSFDYSFIYADEVLAKYRVHERSTGRVQRRGYKINRVKVFHRTLRNYPGISSKLKAGIFYHLGMALIGLGKRKYANRCFIRSMKFQRMNVRALCGLLLSLSKAPSRQLQSSH
jgi:glycosyltransferase involved in cell wall biosynthesis